MSLPEGTKKHSRNYHNPWWEILLKTITTGAALDGRVMGALRNSHISWIPSYSLGWSKQNSKYHVFITHVCIQYNIDIYIYTYTYTYAYTYTYIYIYIHCVYIYVVIYIYVYIYNCIYCILVSPWTQLQFLYCTLYITCICIILYMRGVLTCQYVYICTLCTQFYYTSL